MTNFQLRIHHSPGGGTRVRADHRGHKDIIRMMKTKIATLLMLMSICSYGQISINFEVDDYRLQWEGECGDCDIFPGFDGLPDPWMDVELKLGSSVNAPLRIFRTLNEWNSLNCSSLNPLPKYLEGVSEIDAPRQEAEYFELNNGVWATDSYIEIWLDAAEEDEQCKLFGASYTNDDADCVGPIKVSTINFADFEPCYTHSFWIDEYCSSDGDAGTWGIHVSFSYQFINPTAGEIEIANVPGIGSYCEGSNLPPIQSVIDADEGFIQWEKQEIYENGTFSQWLEIDGANSQNYDPGQIDFSMLGVVQLKYRRVYYPCNNPNLISNEVTFSISQRRPLYKDEDQDGFGTEEIVANYCIHEINICLVQGTCSFISGDCNDHDPLINPEADEICDNIDNNCNSLIDDDDSSVIGQALWYQDADGDGFGNPAQAIFSCNLPNGYVDNDLDNCIANYNPDQSDSDCDSVGDPCDICPGVDDTIDYNGDGLPDCKYPPSIDEILDDWICGKNKVLVFHSPPGNTANAKVICVSYNSLSAHINNGSFLGDAIACQNQNLARANRNTTRVPAFYYDKAGTIRAPMSITPNPNFGKALIAFDRVNEQGVLAISSMSGTLLHFQQLPQGTSSIELDLETLNMSDGVYILTTSIDGINASMKMLTIRK